VTNRTGTPTVSGDIGGGGQLPWLAAAVITLPILLKIVLMLVATCGIIAPAATTTNSAISVLDQILATSVLPQAATEQRPRDAFGLNKRREKDETIHVASQLKRNSRSNFRSPRGIRRWRSTFDSMPHSPPHRNQYGRDLIGWCAIPSAVVFRVK